MISKFKYNKRCLLVFSFKINVVATDGDVRVYVDFDTGVSRSYCPVASGG